jgi:sugar phosphate isomerase/epimerase
MSTQIGAQCYTIRDHCSTPVDIARSLKRLKEMGFDAIQASAAGFNTISARELKKILDDTGIVCVATHRGADALKDVQAQVDWHQEVGCGLTAVGGVGFEGMPRADWERWAREFNELAKRYQGTGLKIGYHNHSHEFAPFGYAENPAAIDPTQNPQHLLLETFGEDVWFEIDVYWVQHGGADPAQWIENCKGRVPAIHVKDMTVVTKAGQKMCEVGRGNLNWPRILESAKAAGVQWYLIERDNGDVEPFESLKISLEQLRAWGLK